MIRYSVVCLCLVAPVFAAAPPEMRYEYRRNHDPDGIGKFYMGREIAWVMSFHGANWLERPERVKEERSDKLLKLLPIKPGMTVVDMGAGSGYYTFPMAAKVGPKGKVLAVDIQKEMLDIIRRRMRALEVNNVEPVKGTIDDPNLKPNSVDLILMVDVYHEFSHPYEMTTKMVEALKPGGLLVFVEFRLEDPRVPIKLVHKMSEKQVIKEMGPHPVKHVKTIGSLPWQHVILFEKKAKDD
jgi:precorrin-6B methylase 2